MSKALPFPIQIKFAFIEIYSTLITIHTNQAYRSGYEKRNFSGMCKQEEIPKEPASANIIMISIDMLYMFHVEFTRM